MTDTPAALREAHHADVSGGWLRPAVFGAMDGLVTNIALIAGVGGGGVSPRNVVLTGAAGLVAGAISMGLGEYTSVRSANEQVAAEVAKERRELERHPEAEARELADAWVARGLPRELATQVAEAVRANPEEALRVHVREELGVDPDDQPSPWAAAISSFVCFSIGALVPLLPYLLGFTSLWLALAVGGVGLFVAGAIVARFTNRALVACRSAAAAARRAGGRRHLPDRRADRRRRRHRLRLEPSSAGQQVVDRAVDRPPPGGQFLGLAGQRRAHLGHVRPGQPGTPHRVPGVAEVGAAEQPLHRRRGQPRLAEHEQRLVRLVPLGQPQRPGVRRAAPVPRLPRRAGELGGPGTRKSCQVLVAQLRQPAGRIVQGAGGDVPISDQRPAGT